MDYLTRECNVIHRDLAARNCLVVASSDNGPPVIKVSDFDRSIQNVGENTVVKRKEQDVPLRWMALESILHDEYSWRSDVFSYGVVCWEVFTGGMMPYPAIPLSELRQYLLEGERLPQPKACPPSVFRIMESCFDEDVASRPLFNAILVDLCEEDTGQEDAVFQSWV